MTDNQEKWGVQFWGALRSITTSKKAMASLTGLAAAGIAKWLKVPTEDILVIISPVMAYVVGQGVADAGKEKAKIENGAKKNNDKAQS